ncbi:GNAT family N-acetyltransferase [Pedobacter terrae]|uniref:GNAT family N-acetyltransferase n=1 Tax=Pedobacter terrae TaxID=405671 RepID=UPI003FA7726F
MPAYQGQRFINEVLKAVLKKEFRKIQLNSIVAYTHYGNSKSICCLERADFKR